MPHNTFCRYLPFYLRYFLYFLNEIPLVFPAETFPETKHSPPSPFAASVSEYYISRQEAGKKEKEEESSREESRAKGKR